MADKQHDDFVELCRKLRELGAVQVKTEDYEATFTPVLQARPAVPPAQAKPAAKLTEDQKRAKQQSDFAKELERV